MPSNNEQVVKILRPEYVGKFQCDGHACDSHCCRVWAITFDEETYQRYQNFPDPKFRARLQANLEMREGKPAFKLCKNGDCPMLRMDGLCDIQKNYGEEWLSITCALFPRVPYTIGLHASMGLTLACPVAREMILLHPETLRLEKVETTIPRNAVNVTIPKMSGVVFQFVQQTAVEILQRKGHTFDQRLLNLGFFLDRLDELLEKDPKAEGLLDVADYYTSREADKLTSKVHLDVATHLRFLFGWMNAVQAKGKADAFYVFKNKVGTSLFGWVSEAYGIKNAENKLLHIAKAYVNNYEQYAKKIAKPYEQILENYLVNEIFVEGFPCKDEGSVLRDYQLFVADWKLLEFFLGAWAATHETVLREDVLHILETVEKAAFHLPGYADDFLAYSQEKKLPLLQWMGTMLEGA